MLLSNTLLAQYTIQSQTSLHEIRNVQPSSSTIEFEYSNHFIIVSLLINGLPLKFILDTGAGYTILFKKEYAPILGLKFERNILFFGADREDTLVAHLSRNANIGISKYLIPTDLMVMEEDVFQLERFTDFEIDGILGGNFLKQFVLSIDYEKQEITFEKPKEYKEAKCSKCQILPIQILRNKPFIETKVGIRPGMKTPVTLLLDTGAALALLLYSNTDTLLQPPDKNIIGQLGLGLGGFLSGHIGRISDFWLGDSRFNGVISHFQDTDPLDTLQLETNRNGIIGNAILQRYKITIHYQNRYIRMKPTKHIEKPFRFDRVGMMIVRGEGQKSRYLVQDIVPNSPASMAGIQRGDAIKKIGWIPSTILGLEGIYRKLSDSDNGQIKITLDRNGQLIKAKVTPKDLI